MEIPKIIRISIGIALGLFGFLGVAFGILAMIDPVGAKGSDDGDPFGTPPTFFFSLLLTIAYLAITSAGIFLIAYKGKNSNSN
jgi:hypothetical protein